MRQRRRRFGCLTSLLGGVAIVALAVAVFYAADALLYAPWAYGILGPTLTGDWGGTVRTSGGTHYVLYLELNRKRTSHGTPINTRGRANIDGHLSWCAPGMPNTTAGLYGSANRSASIVSFEVGAPAHPHPGLLPFQFRGAFHGSTLVLRVRFRLYRNHAYVYSTAIPDEVKSVRLTLRKQGYSTYQAACARR